jgi:DNA polymerase III epsilon subunit family exonuclease
MSVKTPAVLLWCIMNKSISDHTFVVIDLETTGISKLDRICEIGMIRIEGSEIVDRFDTLVNPEFNITNTIFHGIENWMVKDAPRFIDIADQVADYIKDTVLIAHNAPFDMRFIRYEFQRLRTDLSNLALCTLKLARKLHPRFPTHRLDFMLREYDIINEHHHRAVSDAESSARLFLQMQPRLENAGLDTISSLKKWGLPYDHKWCEETLVENNNRGCELITRDHVISCSN